MESRSNGGVGDDGPVRTPRREYRTWHLHDAGGPALRLVVRYRDAEEVPDWRDGPDLPEALAAADDEGWREFDREPGGAPGEYGIVHLVREVRSRKESAHEHA